MWCTVGCAGMFRDRKLSQHCKLTFISHIFINWFLIFEFFCYILYVYCDIDAYAESRLFCSCSTHAPTGPLFLCICLFIYILFIYFCLIVFINLYFVSALCFLANKVCLCLYRNWPSNAMSILNSFIYVKSNSYFISPVRLYMVVSCNRYSESFFYGLIPLFQLDLCRLFTPTTAAVIIGQKEGRL